MARNRFNGLFPFPVPDAASVPITLPTAQYPLGLSLADALTAYHLVRTYTLAFAGSVSTEPAEPGYSYGGSSSGIYSLNYNRPFRGLLPGASPSMSETWLAVEGARLLGQQPAWYLNVGSAQGMTTRMVPPATTPTTTNFGTGPNVPAIDNILGCSLFGTTLLPSATDPVSGGFVIDRTPCYPIIRDGGLYYPQFGAMFWSLNVGFIAASYPFAYVVPTSPPSPYSQSDLPGAVAVTTPWGSFTGSMAVYVEKDFAPLGPHTSASLTLGIQDYWEYRGNDGVVLYNSATGAPAVNPATGAPFTPSEIAAAPVP